MKKLSHCLKLLALGEMTKLQSYGETPRVGIRDRCLPVGIHWEVGYNLSPFSVWDLSSNSCVEQDSLTDSFISSSILDETATQLWVSLAFQLLGTDRGCPPLLAQANFPYFPEASALETFFFCFLCLGQQLGGAKDQPWNRQPQPAEAKAVYVLFVIIQQARIIYQEHKCTHYQ